MTHLFDVRAWSRVEHNGTPIFVHADPPHWFVPNAAGDRILQTLAAGGPALEDPLALMFLQRLPRLPSEDYLGRAWQLETDALDQVWFHLLDECDQRCKHCMFSDDHRGGGRLDREVALDLARQAHGLGCRTFLLTGGEPLLHPELPAVVDGLLALDQASVVLLTNGTRLLDQADALRRWRGGRLRVQVSVDGTQQSHDWARGEGAFAALIPNMALLADQGLPFGLSMCVSQTNLDDMPQMPALAASWGAQRVHYHWHHGGRGKATPNSLPNPKHLLPLLVEAFGQAREHQVVIDNLGILRRQVFAPVGVVHDGTRSGWRSLAVGPDRRLYPSPLLVGLDEMAAPLDRDLATTWRDAPAMERARQATAAAGDDPMRLLLGGGDLDYGLRSGTGEDPYWPLHKAAACWLIEQEVAALEPPPDAPGLRMQKGDLRLAPGVGSGVELAPVVWIDLDPRRLPEVGVDSVPQGQATIYPELAVDHVPPEVLAGDQGAGSPVMQAGVVAGERVLDLGCDRGIECFVASRMVGAMGQVFGVDARQAMVDRCSRDASSVARKLGYGNLQFLVGAPEQIPLPDASVDLVLGNFSFNRCLHLRRALAEVRRVLRPGGRLVLRTLVCDDEPGPAIRNEADAWARGLAGALSPQQLMALLAEGGLGQAMLVERTPCCVEHGHRFFWCTIKTRPSATQQEQELVEVIYRGPLPALVSPSGRLLPVGQACHVPVAEAQALARQLLAADGGRLVPPDSEHEGFGEQDVTLEHRSGGLRAPSSKDDLDARSTLEQPRKPTTTDEMDPIDRALTVEFSQPEWARDGADAGENTPLTASASASGSHQTSGEIETGAVLAVEAASPPADCQCLNEQHPGDARQGEGCMVCGAELDYPKEPQEAMCHYCMRSFPGDALCKDGHYVCDACHVEDGLSVLEHVCVTTNETDMVALLRRIREHKAIPMHGPEHHAMVPAIILATCRNLGGEVTDDQIRRAIRRGTKIAGGACGLMGVCGAAVGTGIAFSVLLSANPRKATERQQVMSITNKVLERIAAMRAARCCQRDVYLALKAVAELSTEHLGLTLRADAPYPCQQSDRNKECPGDACPLHPERELLALPPAE